MSQKVYMPLVIGDWLKGTRGMRAEVKGIYIGLLVHQWDHGFIPDDLEDLALIEPEVGKVWVKLEIKFPVSSPGRRQNLKCEEVRAFWAKQRKNGGNGGRPPKNNPNNNPDLNPNNNPKHNHHIDLDYDNDIKFKKERVKREEPIEPDEVFADCERWTDNVLSGSDWMFNDKLRNMSINPGDRLPELCHTHLALLAQYPRKRPSDQNKFRLSLIGHIIEKLKIQPNEQAQRTPRSTVSKVIGQTDYSGKL